MTYFIYMDKKIATKFNSSSAKNTKELKIRVHRLKNKGFSKPIIRN